MWFVIPIWSLFWVFYIDYKPRKDNINCIIFYIDIYAMMRHNNKQRTYNTLKIESIGFVFLDSQTITNDHLS